jgi:endonuclease/exonuclease/phosphatase family metal-dependent hydrolase
MVTHCALSAQHIQRFAKNDPFVYLGDFNIKPDSSMYQLLTQGTLEPKVQYTAIGSSCENIARYYLCLSTDLYLTYLSSIFISCSTPTIPRSRPVTRGPPPCSRPCPAPT